MLRCGPNYCNLHSRHPGGGGSWGVACYRRLAYKLTPQQHLVSFVFFLKHNNNMTHSSGIGPRMPCMTIQYLLHLASTRRKIEIEWLNLYEMEELVGSTTKTLMVRRNNIWHSNKKHVDHTKDSNHAWWFNGRGKRRVWLINIRDRSQCLLYLCWPYIWRVIIQCYHT